MTDTTIPLGHATVDIVPPASDPMLAAQQHIGSLREAAQVLEDWDQADVLGRLETIVDHARRVALPTASAHYAAEKAGPLLEGAISLQRATLAGYADAPDPAAVEASIERLDEATRHLADVADAVRSVMWSIARLGAPTESAAEDLRLAVGHLTRWTSAQVAASVPDPEG